MPSRPFEIRGNLESSYPDVFTPEALAALTALAPLDADRKAIMKARIARRGARMRDRQRIAFLDPQSVIPRTQITVQDARDGKFIGSEIPNDLKRQWIQGTGPAARPGATVETGLRNIAYALLSGADGWMFDGEDALGQVDTMSLDNQRNLKLAFARDPLFLDVAEEVARRSTAEALAVSHRLGELAVGELAIERVGEIDVDQGHRRSDEPDQNEKQLGTDAELHGFSFR